MSSTPEPQTEPEGQSLNRIWAEIKASQVPLPLKCLGIIKAWREDNSISPFEFGCQALELIEELAIQARGGHPL